jgi:hypothetical protein
MTERRPIGFHFQAIWFDSDLIELCVSAWNGTFGGTADIYEAIGDLEEAAAQLRGFPRNPSDRREIIFGNFDRKCAGGGVKMRFHCIGGAGHSFVEATIDSNCESAGTFQTAVLSMPVEAAAIDVFVQELQRVGANRAGTAYLKGPG